VRWGFLDAVFEQKESPDARVAEKLAREMLAKDPALKAEFEAKVASDPAFAKDATARLANCPHTETIDCDTVNTSRWSEMFGVPIAAYAIPTYLLVLLLAWMDRPNLPTLAYAFSIGLLTTAASAFLLFVSKTQIEKRYPKNTLGAYSLKLSSSLFIDSALSRGVGACANAPVKGIRPNVCFVTHAEQECSFGGGPPHQRWRRDLCLVRSRLLAEGGRTPLHCRCS